MDPDINVEYPARARTCAKLASRLILLRLVATIDFGKQKCVLFGVGASDANRMLWPSLFAFEMHVCSRASRWFPKALVAKIQNSESNTPYTIYTKTILRITKLS